MPNNPNLHLPPLTPPPTEAPEPMSIDGVEQDAALSSASHLTHEEVMSRRSRRMKQLAKIYRAHYWALMEELKAKHKEYYWNYGRSPFKEEEKKKRENPNSAVDQNSGFVAKEEEGFRKCSATGCKAKAMALTRFCHPHILLDSKQKLYKGCAFVVKCSAQGRTVLCGKPISRSTVPAFCPAHLQKAERHLSRALKKAGLNVSSMSTLSPKLHVIVAEFVRHIQTKRRAALKENVAEVEVEDDKNSDGS